RRPRFRNRLCDRGVPVPARAAGARIEHPPLPEGGLMTVAAAQAPPILDERVSARILRGLGKAPVHLFLVLVGLLWLLPTFGLFMTSLLSAASINSGGWWRIFSKPSLLTLESYRNLFNNHTITSSLVTTLEIAVGATVLP